MLQILKFGATFCGPCRVIKPIVEEISNETGIEVIHYDADEHESIFAQYNIRAVPTLVFLKNGVEVERKTGLLTKDILKKIVDNLG